MSDEKDEQSRSETFPFDRGASSGQGSWNSSPDASGQGSQSGPQSYGQAEPGQDGYGQQPSAYGQPAAYGEPPAYGQSAGAYGEQPPAYGQPAEAAPYGYQQYGVQPYGQQPYGQVAGQQYGYGVPAPAKPGGVITAAVLGFVFGAMGVLVSGLLLIGGAIIVGAGSGASDLDNEIPGLGNALGGALGAIAGVVVVIGILAVAWTVLVIWGSVWALTGRSRVLLIVGGSISIVVTGIGLVGNLSDSGGSPGDVVVSLLFFAAAVAIVVLLSLPPASAYFAAHRALRAR